jgi:glycosyltransferase involved in cell wall biosynthesis
MVKRILFYRDFKDYTGGHQKVADYFNHLRSTPCFEPSISFSQQTRWNDANPWYPEYRNSNIEYVPEEYDYIFLAGTDWKQYLMFGSSHKPVVNLVQHVRHADPSADVYPYLSERAIRVCVSREVEAAIMGTGRVNGPTFVIPNGIAVPDLPQEIGKSIDLLILGNKTPDLAKSLGEHFSKHSLRMKVITSLVPRAELMQLMASAKIFVGLPNLSEGFYLPALEAMGLSELVVVPDCVGNRGFCIHLNTCLMCEYNLESLIDTVTKAIQISNTPKIANEIKWNAKAKVKQHSLAVERELFLRVMNDIDFLWNNERNFLRPTAND